MKNLFILLAMIGFSSPTYARGSLVGSTDVLSSATKTPSGVLLFDESGNVAAPIKADVSESTVTVNTPRSLKDTFADRVNVKDYGAKGDGSTDDTAAFTKAFSSASTAGRVIHVPAGTYNLSSWLAIPNNAVMDIDVGVAINGGGIIGLEDSVTHLGHSLAVNAADGKVSIGNYISMYNNQSSSTADYEHDGQYLHVIQADSRASDISYHHDLTGQHIGVEMLSNLPSSGSIWGQDLTVTVPSNSNGYAVGQEIEVFSNAPSGDIDTITQHIGQNIICQGTQNCTVAIRPSASPGKWNDVLVSRTSEIANNFLRILGATSNNEKDDIFHISGKGAVMAATYQETLTTPASSTAACTTGTFTDDTNYHYVCVATNTWKRVALSSW